MFHALCIRFATRIRACRRSLLGDIRGMTLVETSVLLGAAAILTSSLATVGFRTVDVARGVVGREDVERIGAALGQLLADRGNLVLTSADGTRVQLLAGAGEAPDAPGDALLAAPIDGRGVAGLADVLYSNDFGLPEPAGEWQPGWRGPYLQVRSDADPWGHRYAVRLSGPALYVLSAGPDGIVQTTGDARAPRVSGDDILYLLAASGS